VFAIDKGQERVGVNECVHGGVLIGEVLFGIVTSTEPNRPDLHRTHSRFIVNGIIMLLVLYATARFLNLYLTSMLFQAFFAFFAVIMAVIFQRELRSFFEWLYICWNSLSRGKNSASCGQPSPTLILVAPSTTAGELPHVTPLHSSRPMRPADGNNGGRVTQV
jgi:hypothetical protein